VKLFSCSQCQQLLFFESVQCLGCGRDLAYLPDRGLVSALAPTPGGAWQALAPSAHGATYRLCRNHRDHGVCNWAVPANDPIEYCRACRLNEMIPNLEAPGAREAWHRLEIAKRRLLYTLFALGLPVEGKAPGDGNGDQPGLAFAFLADAPAAGTQVFTGHSDGLVTINIAEADDPFRERVRVQMGEPYRTLLGHFRHEIGHYYWDRLISESRWLGPFRERFGDEGADYAEAQKRHYDSGPRPDWAANHVSAYASMHPWEDWAESWAHYLHITDTLETARAYGLAVAPRPVAGPSQIAPVAVRRLDPHAFDDLMNGWVPLTMALNSLNRSMGARDSYPFVLSPAAIAKLRFVHDVIEETRGYVG
jgi:hypothetical protein